jgi:undecaprenyl-diphosphatase
MVRKRHIAVAFAAALLFAWLARWVLTGESMAFDLRIRNAVHTFASPWLTRVLWAITMLGWIGVMLPVGALVAWRLTALGHGRKAILLAGGTLSAELASYVLKMAFYRQRPEVFFGLPLAENYSFPSGHSFVGTVFYGLLASILLRKRRWIAAVTILMAALLGLSRVYLGYHYPTDVLGGWDCAAAWLALTGMPVDASREPQK